MTKLDDEGWGIDPEQKIERDIQGILKQQDAKARTRPLGSPAPNEKLLSRKEAARYLTDRGCPTSHRLLEKCASKNANTKGPALTRIGRAVWYRPSDLEAWASTRVKRDR